MLAYEKQQVERQNISLLTQDSSKLGNLFLQNLAESTCSVEF